MALRVRPEPPWATVDELCLPFPDPFSARNAPQLDRNQRLNIFRVWLSGHSHHETTACPDAEHILGQSDSPCQEKSQRSLKLSDSVA